MPQYVSNSGFLYDIHLDIQYSKYMQWKHRRFHAACIVFSTLANICSLHNKLKLFKRVMTLSIITTLLSFSLFYFIS